MFINNFDPVAIEIFSLEIRWYSLAYIAGILFGWLVAKKMFIENEDFNKKFDDGHDWLFCRNHNWNASRLRTNDCNCVNDTNNIWI